MVVVDSGVGSTIEWLVPIGPTDVLQEILRWKNHVYSGLVFMRSIVLDTNEGTNEVLMK